MIYLENFNMFNESIKLSQEEKDFLWTKMEYKKKRKNLEKLTDIYLYLNSDKDIPNEETFKDVLDSLEYSVKKRIKDVDQKAPRGKYKEAFNSLRNKIPSDWIGVKYSNIKAKKKQDEDK